MTSPGIARITSGMTENADDILSLLPGRLKDARQAQGLSLEAVANLSGVSRSMVSQIERGESSPTIVTLWNLTRALQVDFAGLLDAASAHDRIDVLRYADTPVIEARGQDCRIRILSPPEDVGGHEVYDIDFETRGALRSQPHNRGAREQLTVVSGSVQVTAANLSEILTTGDTARYAADVDHSIIAVDGPARVFLIVKSG